LAAQVREEVDDLAPVELRDVEAEAPDRRDHRGPVVPEVLRDPERRCPARQGVETRAGAPTFLAEAVALDAVLLREEDLADLGAARLVEVIQEIEERQKVRELVVTEAGAHEPELLHLVAHRERVVPERGGDLVKRSLDRRTAQVRPEHRRDHDAEETEPPSGAFSHASPRARRGDSSRSAS